MASANSVLELASFQTNCAQCNLGPQCLPCGLGAKHTAELNAQVKRRRPLSRGDYVYHAGDRFRSLFAVRSGLVKTYTLDAAGNEHITGFHFPGELIGLDAVANGRHDRFARALDTTSLCEIPYDRLDELSGRIPALRHQLVRLMSQEILREEQMLMRLARMTADQRLAAFFYQLFERFSRLGYSGTRFALRISNQDLGRYLGLASETVSRLLAQLRAKGLLTVQKKQVEIHNVAQLRSAACEDEFEVAIGG